MRLSRRWKIAGGVVIVVAGAATWTVMHYHLLDGTNSTPLSVEEARERYRDSTSTTADTQPATTLTVGTTIATSASTSSTSSTPSTSLPPVDAQLPALGVYVYTTTGGDAVDALAGAHHDYPATTTITVTASDCGVLQRWDLLQERWEEWVRCIDGDSISQPARTTFDSFFGQTQTDAYVCTGESRPVDAPPGTTWTTSCVQGDDTDVYDGTVIGTETQQVDGQDVPTMHVRVAITTSEPSDVQTIDTWYQAGSDLVIAQTASAATTNPSPIGAVHYTENYEIRLTSLTPLT